MRKAELLLRIDFLFNNVDLTHRRIDRLEAEVKALKDARHTRSNGPSQ